MKRLGYLLKLDFHENLKAFIWTSVTMLLMYLFFFWWAHIIGIPLNSYSLSKGLFSPEHIEMVTKAQCEAVGRFGAIAMFFCFLMTASLLYGKEQKKQFRSALLMLPASNLEKFLSRWLYMIVFSVIVGILTFIIADAFHILFLSSVDRPLISATKYFFDTWPRGGDSYGIYLTFILIHSAYLFGGVFFSRNHFAITSLFLVIFGIFFVKIINFFVPSIFPVYRPFVISICFVCSIILFTWLAYRTFCRWQLINRKYVNL